MLNKNIQVKIKVSFHYFSLFRGHFSNCSRDTALSKIWCCFPYSEDFASFWGHRKRPRRYTKMTTLINNTRLKTAVPQVTNDCWRLWLEICGKGGGRLERKMKNTWKPWLHPNDGANCRSDTDKSQWIPRLPMKITEDRVIEMLQIVAELWHEKNTNNEQLCH